MPDFDNVPRNPVGRLHEVLTHLKGSAAPGRQVGTVLSEYFGADDDAISRMQIYSDLARLVAEAAEAVQDLEGYEEDAIDEYASELHIVASAIASASPISDSSHFNNRINGEIMRGLLSLSRILNKEAPDKVIPSENLKEILESVQNLTTDIIDADIDTTLKAVLLTHLQEIEHALIVFRLHGAKGLQYATDGLAGASVLGLVSTTEPETRKWLARCGNLAGAISGFTGFAANAGKVFEVVSQHLPQMLK